MNEIRGTLISFVIGTAAAVSIALWQNSFLENVWTAWSNGFFTVSVLWLGLGALTWIAAFGGFDGWRYLTYVFREKYFSRKPKLKSYFDFKQERMEKKETRPQKLLLLPGALYLLAAGICALLSM